MSSYLVKPKLYNTGFIPPSAALLRIKQGLTPQDISNACAYTPPPTHQRAYANSHLTKRVGKPTVKTLEGVVS